MNTITIKTKTGNLVGLIKEETNQFYGIPFALPPVGKNRFKRAVPLKACTDIIDCTAFKQKAVQPMAGALHFENDIKQSEHCLYLNIWSPKNQTIKKPVAVWIHGGAFLMGEASHKIYDGNNFSVNGDIVFISIQYRLGIFGFMDFSHLNTKDYSFDTNIGLSDQIEALRWIQENVGYFGGDKNNVTIMGESAGASSVLSLIASPKANNLFHKAISQSAVVDTIMSKKNATFWATKAMEIMGLEAGDAKGLFNIPTEVALETTVKINQIFTEIMPGSWPFGPVVDRDLLPSTIVDAYLRHKVAEIPLLIGINKDESSNFVRDKEPWLPSNERHIDRFFDLNPSLDKNTILKHYKTYPSIEAYRAFGRDLSFVCGNTKVAYLNAMKQSTYVYQFDYETIVTKKLGIGAFHGIELMFTFNNLDSELSKILSYETTNPPIVANMVHNYWINFIKRGNPNSDGLYQWQKYSKDRRLVISLDLEPKTLNDPDKKGYEIWKDLSVY